MVSGSPGGGRPLSVGQAKPPTWCILHGDHEGLVLQEVLVVLDDVGVVEQLQHLALVLRRLPLLLCHLLHRDMLDNHQLLVGLSEAQVHNPRTRAASGRQLSFQPHIRAVQGRVRRP